MSQTLLVVGALALADALVLQQQQSHQDTDLGLVESKVAAGAHRVAVDWLAAHADLPFDPALVGGTPAEDEGDEGDGDGDEDEGDDDELLEVVTSQQLLSQPIMATCSVGGLGCLTSLNDLNGRIEQVVHAVGGQAITYRVVATVTYALGDGTDASTTQATKYKKVAVTVSAPDVPAATRPGPVHLSELVACGSPCAW